MLSLEYETVPALYAPEVVRGNPPVPSEPASPLTLELATVSFESFAGRSRWRQTTRWTGSFIGMTTAMWRLFSSTRVILEAVDHARAALRKETSHTEH